jgi:hypothetical protein
VCKTLRTPSYIYPPPKKHFFLWGIESDADNYIYGSYNVSAIFKLIYPIKINILKQFLKRTLS